VPALLDHRSPWLEMLEPAIPVPELLAPAMPVPVSDVPSTPKPAAQLPCRPVPAPLAVQSRVAPPPVLLLIFVTSVSELAWPRMTLPPLAAAAGAGLAMASAAMTAAIAPVPRASSCRLLRRAGGRGGGPAPGPVLPAAR